MIGNLGERGGDVQQKGHRLELAPELQRSQESLMSNNTRSTYRESELNRKSLEKKQKPSQVGQSV